MKNRVFKQIVVVFVLFILGLLWSCGNSSKENKQDVIVVNPTNSPIQRQVYNIQLGKKYTYNELLFELQKNIDNLVSEENNDEFSYKPELHVSKDNNYLSYFIFCLRSSYQHYLFGNHNWDDFHCYSTLDGRIYSIEFSSSGDGVYALAHKNLYQKLLEQLTQKYGEPNHYPKDSDNCVFWMDESTVLELYCSHRTDNDYGSISIEYRDPIIFNEVVNEQKTEGYNEL